MGEFSITHILMIGAVVILFFGPSRLPKAGRSIGEAIRGFKKGLKGDEIDVTEQSRPAETTIDHLHAPQQDPLTDRQTDPLAQKQRDKTRQDS